MRSLLLTFAILAALPAAAATYYVNPSCSTGGTGTADSCSGATRSFHDIQDCAAVAQAGDTCLIYPGNYYRPTTPPDYLDGGYQPVRSGTVGNPITFKNYNATRPVVCSGPSCLYTNPSDFTNPGASTGNFAYIVFDGIDVHGSFGMSGDHNTLQNSEIQGGFVWSNNCATGSGSDTNWAGIRVGRASSAANYYVTFPTVRNVYIHNILGCNQGDRSFGIMSYDSKNGLYENMTIEGTGSMCVYHKEDPEGNEYRYNKFIDCSQWDTGPNVQGSNQANPLTGGQGGGNYYHHNVFTCNPSVATDRDRYIAYFQNNEQSTTPNRFENNTVSGCNGFVGGAAGSGDNSVFTFKDNYVALVSGAGKYNFGVAQYGTACAGCSIVSMDYNVYLRQTFRWNTSAAGDHAFTDSVTGLSDWQTYWATRGGFEVHSRARDCGMTGGNTPGSNFAITDPVCRTASSTNGYVGALTPTVTCVGYGCSVPAVCGDNVATGAEVCDDGNTTTETSCPYGVPSCTRCNASCTAVLSLSGPFCGDAIVQSANGENCDGSNLNGQTCATLVPGTTGTPLCQSCQFNTSPCVGAATTAGSLSAGTVSGGEILP